MDTMRRRRIGGLGFLVAIAALAVGCGEITAQDGPDAGGGVGGAAGSIDPGTGGAGTGGAPVVHPGTGGMAVAPGTGGTAPTSYLSCESYGWRPGGGGQCSKEISVGRWIYGSKDGRACYECDTPIRPSGIPECLLPGTTNLCVLSCDECTFQ